MTPIHYAASAAAAAAAAFGRALGITPPTPDADPRLAPVEGDEVDDIVNWQLSQPHQ